MSFRTMIKNLAGGEIPGVAEGLAKIKINDALRLIYDETDWSFQTIYGGWLNPGMVASVGTVTVTPFSNIVIGDAAASAAWAAVTTFPFTSLQFRNPTYSLYNIVAYDTTSNPPFGTLTLDRPWMEPVTGAGQPYWIYQAYFPVPVQDFHKFIEIRDTIDNAPVLFNQLSQADLADRDPQRLIFGPTVPTFAVPYGTDNRLNSSTPGWLLYEIWPHNLSYMPYSFSAKRKGPNLVNNSDTVLYPLEDALVEHRARAALYLFKEAQKGEQVQRGAGADWKFLAEAEIKLYADKLKKIRAVDANLHRDFVTRAKDVAASPDGYSTMRTGDLNIGVPNGWR